MSSAKRKTVKRMIGDCITILTIIAIFVFSVSCIGFIIFTFISSSASAATEKSAADKFQEAMQYANSFKDVVQTEKTGEGNVNLKVNSFKLKPGEAFIDPKTKKSWYMDNPAQSNYYNQGNAHGMEKEAIAETSRDENYKDANGNPVPTPGKTVISSFQTRPIYKVTKDDEYIVKGNQLTKNSKDIINGNLGGDIKCKDGKEKQVNCESTYEQKICNEEVRTIKRIREEAVEVVFIDDPYSGCKKHTSPPAIEDCLAGEVQIPHYQGTGYGIIEIPKNRGARIGFSDSRHPHYYITATNKITGKVVIPRRQVSNGVYIELPISKDQDQTFNFVVERWDRCTCNQPGHMNVYINYMRKIPKVEWKEVSKRDI
jgi:hypothetical protein